MTEQPTSVLPQEAAVATKRPYRRKPKPEAASGAEPSAHMQEPSATGPAILPKSAVKRGRRKTASNLEIAIAAALSELGAPESPTRKTRRTKAAAVENASSAPPVEPTPTIPPARTEPAPTPLTSLAGEAGTDAAARPKRAYQKRGSKALPPTEVSSGAIDAPSAHVPTAQPEVALRPQHFEEASAHVQQPQQPQQDLPRRPYPVYVPLHVAKQLEQEGRPAPLSVAQDQYAPTGTHTPHAPHTLATRGHTPENRHGAPQPSAQSATPQREDHFQGRHQRQGERHERQDRAPQDRVPQDRSPRDRDRDRGTERVQENRAQDRPGRNDRPDRNERHERKRGRHDRRRDERPDEHSQRGGGGEFRPHHESSRELPPPSPEELTEGEGIIEISGKGFGFLRDRSRNFTQSPLDIFVSPEMVRRFNLRDGQWIKGSVRKSGRGHQMHEITSVNGDAPDASRLQPSFDELTVINPSEPLIMATTPERYTTRIIDMVTPIGKGQRGLIVAPPRTGKTTLLQHIADAMMKNHPEVQLIMLLVDERPEEVTEIRHTVPKAEIMASSNDMDVRSHTRIAELAIERAKRLVEAGKDVFILLDSITRLGRAFNNAMTNGGRTMSGGIDARAMEIPRRLFAAARNTEEAGSLTIIATALIETGSRMDEIIFQEFKGTGNMELVLDRKIAEQRIYPAVDIFQSGTRREELLVPADTLQKISFLRRGLSGCRPADAIDRLLFYLKKFQTNDQMLREIRG